MFPCLNLVIFYLTFIQMIQRINGTRCFTCQTGPERIICSLQTECTGKGCYVIMDGKNNAAGCTSDIDPTTRLVGCFNETSTRKVCACYTNFCNTPIGTVSFVSLPSSPLTANISAPWDLGFIPTTTLLPATITTTTILPTTVTLSTTPELTTSILTTTIIPTTVTSVLTTTITSTTTLIPTTSSMPATTSTTTKIPSTVSTYPTTTVIPSTTSLPVQTTTKNSSLKYTLSIPSYIFIIVLIAKNKLNV